MILTSSERGARRGAALAFGAAMLVVLGVLAVGYDAALDSRGKAGGWGFALAFAASVSFVATLVFAVLLVLLAPRGIAMAARSARRAGAALGAGVSLLVIGVNLVARWITGAGGIGHIGTLVLLVVLCAAAAALVASSRADKR